jgi:RimJ/RimL family protein N-acetyltransferase
MREIDTASLRLRAWEHDDIAHLARLWGDPQIMTMLERAPRDLQQSSDAYASIIAHWETHGFGYWAVIERETGNFVGTVGLEHMGDWPLPDKVEVGYVLFPEFWGRGFATEAARASIAFGFEDTPLKRIISTTYPHNHRSRRVMEKCGMTYQGTLYWESRGHAVAWYAIDKVS